MNERNMRRHTVLEAGNAGAGQITPKVIVFLLALTVTLPVPVNSRAVAGVRSVPVVPLSATEIIHKWADHYGVDKDLAVRIARAESGLDCKVQNKNSSAGGLFQFINSTFLSTQKRLGKPQDISRKYDCDENAQLGIYLLSKGELRHWEASRSVWDPSSIAETDVKPEEPSYLIASN
jgi:soluble lytic murein transglycosylase-like protein